MITATIKHVCHLCHKRSAKNKSTANAAAIFASINCSNCSANALQMFYIYLKDDHSLIYKVGRTKSDVGVSKRLNQWVRKCKKNLRLIQKFFVESNHELCEAMIHHELKLNRFWCGNMSCETCEGYHKEF